MAYNFGNMRFYSYSNSSNNENFVRNFNVGLILPPTPPEDHQENSRIAPAIQHCPLNSLNVNQVPVECRAEHEAMISKKSEAQPKKERRQRTAFTNDQLTELERTFSESDYIDRPSRIVLATKLKLSEIHIKTWFQNRRMKQKKENNSTVNPLHSYFNSSNEQNSVDILNVGLILPPTPPEDQQENLRIVPAIQHFPLNPFNVNQAPVENFPICINNHESTNSNDAPEKQEKSERSRTTYTSGQLIELEKEFNLSHYIKRVKRINLAKTLDLSEKNIKMWFQNRRTKYKKEQERIQLSSSQQDNDQTIEVPCVNAKPIPDFSSMSCDYTNPANQFAYPSNYPPVNFSVKTSLAENSENAQNSQVNEHFSSLESSACQIPQTNYFDIPTVADNSFFEQQLLPQSSNQYASCQYQPNQYQYDQVSQEEKNYYDQQSSKNDNDLSFLEYFYEY